MVCKCLDSLLWAPKYLGKFFITDRKLYREYCQTGTVLAVMWVLCQTAMVKRELSRRWGKALDLPVHLDPRYMTNGHEIKGNG